VVCTVFFGHDAIRLAIEIGLPVTHTDSAFYDVSTMGESELNKNTAVMAVR